MIPYQSFVPSNHTAAFENFSKQMKAASASRKSHQAIQSFYLSRLKRFHTDEFAKFSHQKKLFDEWVVQNAMTRSCGLTVTQKFWITVAWSARKHGDAKLPTFRAIMRITVALKSADTVKPDFSSYSSPKFQKKKFWITVACKFCNTTTQNCGPKVTLKILKNWEVLGYCRNSATPRREIAVLQ